MRETKARLTGLERFGLTEASFRSLGNRKVLGLCIPSDIRRDASGPGTPMLETPFIYGRSSESVD